MRASWAVIIATQRLEKMKLIYAIGVLKQIFRLRMDNEPWIQPAYSLLFAHLPFSTEYCWSSRVSGLGYVQSYLNFPFIAGWHVGEDYVSRYVKQGMVIHATHR